MTQEKVEKSREHAPCLALVYHGILHAVCRTLDQAESKTTSHLRNGHIFTFPQLLPESLLSYSPKYMLIFSKKTKHKKIM